MAQVTFAGTGSVLRGDITARDSVARMWRRPFALLLLALAGCAEEPRVAAAPVIFGADDRVEVHEVVDETLRALVVRAVPALVHQRRLAIDPSSGVVTLSGPTLRDRRGLCEGEAFLEQPAVASCSATLIDDDLVLTAGHCVESVECVDQRYVFGWYYDAPDALREIDQSSVYACAEIVAFAHDAQNDYAIVRLDRAAIGPPAEVRRGSVAVGDVVSLAGYPLGIPMKVVESGAVTAPRSATTFYARLDAHPGNSGSGVFDDAHRVIGELTAGPISAFDDGGTCTVLRVIGEDTTRTETINSITPALDALCGSGFESERLCPRVCGDGACDAGETCPADCEPDAGIPDAGATTVDASPLDGGSTAAITPEPDAGLAATMPAGCGCRAAGGPTSSAYALMMLAVVAALSVRRARAHSSGSVVRRGDPPRDSR